MAIYYEEIGDFRLAYDHFRKWYGVCCELYGKQHPKTARPINTLREPVYKNIADRLGDDIPDLPEWQ